MENKFLITFVLVCCGCLMFYLLITSSNGMSAEEINELNKNIAANHQQAKTVATALELSDPKIVCVRPPNYLKTWSVCTIVNNNFVLYLNCHIQSGCYPINTTSR